MPHTAVVVTEQGVGYGSSGYIFMHSSTIMKSAVLWYLLHIPHSSFLLKTVKLRALKITVLDKHNKTKTELLY